jgi:hypothetical protein
MPASVYLWIGTAIFDSAMFWAAWRIGFAIEAGWAFIPAALLGVFVPWALARRSGATNRGAAVLALAGLTFGLVAGTVLWFVFLGYECGHHNRFCFDTV